MKFGKLLQAFQADNEVPECLLDYKKLKKKLKLLSQHKKGPYFDSAEVS